MYFQELTSVLISGRVLSKKQDSQPYPLHNSFSNHKFTTCGCGFTTICLCSRLTCKSWVFMGLCLLVLRRFRFDFSLGVETREQERFSSVAASMRDQNQNP